jgi:type IV secretion system protein VirD4
MMASTYSYVSFETREIQGRMAYGGERNLIVFGPNGSGKGMSFCVPNLLQCTDRSFFVVDPKGELAAMTAPFRRTLGPVMVINPFGIFTEIPGYEDLASCGYNPLVGLDPTKKSFNSDAALLADAVVMVEGKDPHWDRSARALIASLIMWVVLEARGMLSPDVLETAGALPPITGPKGVPTMARVRELLCMASSEPASWNDHKGTGIPALALAMMRTNIPGLRNKAAQFTEWTNEIRSVASSAKIQTEAFDDDEIADDLAKDGVRFESIKERPTTVYLMLPPDMVERHVKWLRLIITSALKAVMRPRRKGEPRVLFLMDEFAALGHLKIIETVWALVRGYGIQLLPIFQDVGQLKGIYSERWETFMGQAGAIMSFAPGDLTTAELLSERSGDRTANVTSRSTSTSTNRGVTEPHWMSNGGPSQSSGSSTSDSSNTTPTKTRAIHRHSLFGLREYATLSFIAGVSDVIPGYAPPFWDIMECARRARANPYRVD